MKFAVRSAFFKALHFLPFSHLISGLLVFTLIGTFYFYSFQALFQTESAFSWRDLIRQSYLWRILGFSFYQAGLSAFLSVLLGFFLAKALFYTHFWGKSFFIRLLSLATVLPTLIVILGLIGVYGQSGWLAQWFEIKINIYGLKGILMAHLFFNLPLATRILLNHLAHIPRQQHQLASQLNFNSWQFFKYLEWPTLRSGILFGFILIFILCFTSFSVVLILGGSPKYTTLELAIYQALTFDFDLKKVAYLASIQIILALLFFTLNLFANQNQTKQLIIQENIWLKKPNLMVNFFYFLIIFLGGLFLSLPIFNLLFSGLEALIEWQFWQNKRLWQALFSSLFLAFASATVGLIFSLGLLLPYRELVFKKHLKSASLLLNCGLIILAIPILVLATGLFILLRDYSVSHWQLFLILIFCNALTIMPFMIHILNKPLLNNLFYYQKLCVSLNIRSWARFYFIERHHLIRPLRYAFALGSALSLGDFTAIALFGHSGFLSLPYLLYQQLGNYRNQEAYFTAFILLSLCILIFLLLERQRD